MKKRINFILILIGSILICTSCGSKVDLKGRVGYLIGDVKIDGKTAIPDMAVSNGNEVITGSNSTCEIVFEGKNIVRVMENSDMIFNLTPLKKGLKIQKGAIETVLRNLDQKNPDPYTVETETAVAAVRGTSFYVSVDEHSNTAVCACNGVVDLAIPGGTNHTTVESKHHTGFYFTRGTNGNVYQSVNLEYKDDAELKQKAGHNDAEMESLAAHIGEKIDWSKIDKSKRN